MLVFELYVWNFIILLFRCQSIVSNYPNYYFEIRGIGSLTSYGVEPGLWSEDEVGCCSQMAVFKRRPNVVIVKDPPGTHV